jgi:hypothetical protein
MHTVVPIGDVAGTAGCDDTSDNAAVRNASSSSISGSTSIVDDTVEICCGCSDLLACSKADAKAHMLSKRLYGSFSKARSTTCSTAGVIAGIFSCKGTGGMNMCCMAVSIA